MPWRIHNNPWNCALIIHENIFNIVQNYDANWTENARNDRNGNNILGRRQPWQVHLE